MHPTETLSLCYTLIYKICICNPSLCTATCFKGQTFKGYSSFKAESKVWNFCIVRLVQLGPLSICVPHSRGTPVAAENRCGSHSDCHCPPCHMPSNCPIAQGVLHLARTPFTKLPCIFSMNARRFLIEQGREAGTSQSLPRPIREHLALTEKNTRYSVNGHLC